MIYFTCFFESIKHVQVLSNYGYDVVDGDGEFQCKIDVTDLEKLRHLIVGLKSNDDHELLTILEDHCHDFDSDGESISSTFEEEIHSLIRSKTE
jgi:hypothetical protein